MDGTLAKRTWNKDATFALKFNKFVVWPLGLWPLQCDDLFSMFRIGYAFVSQVWMILTQSMAAYLNCGDAGDIVDYVMMTGCAIMALSKIIAIRVHMDKVRTIFSSALDDWLSLDAEKSREVLISFAKTGRTVFRFQMISCYISNTLIIIGTLPIFMPPMTNETSWGNASDLPMRQLPLKTGCMFAHYRDEIYGFLYAYESIMIMITAHGNVGCDVFIFSLAMHLCGQIELLKNSMLDVEENPNEPSKSRHRIVRCIQRHSRLLDLAQALDETVSGMMIVQLLLNAGMNLMLGIRVILAVKSGVPLTALRPLMAFNVLMLQLYLLSYAGDRLSQQVNSVIDAVYSSNWYELPAKLRRDLYFMAMRANKPVYITAGQFYVLNIENFMNILKASFSYFSILRVMFDS